MINLPEKWNTPPAFELAAGEVHIWFAELEQSAEVVQRLEHLLDRDESRRASRFYFAKHRRRFAVARGVLRHLLAQYLKISPNNVCFSYSDYGKPHVTKEVYQNHIQFNVSHSEEVALFAFTENQKVGVDVEFMKSKVATTEIAARYFSKKEVNDFHTLPEPLKAKAFFDCWVRKEAFMKADGRGLSLGLSKFDVSLLPESTARLRSVEGSARKAKDWSMASLNVPSNYAAAVVVKGTLEKLRLMQWRPDTIAVDTQK